MNPIFKPTLLPMLLLCVGCASTGRQRSAAPVQQVEPLVGCRFGERNIIIRPNRAQALRLDLLDARAQRYLAAKDPDYPPRDATLWLHVEFNPWQPRSFVVLDYRGGRGRPCWRVIFDAKGEVAGFAKGTGYDIVGDADGRESE